MQNLISHLKKSEKILITSHFKPDGDAIGSMIALMLALKQINNIADMYNKSIIPKKYFNILPSAIKIKKEIKNLDEYDTAIFLDCSSADMAGPEGDKISKIKTVINIDHHKTNPKFGNLHFIEASAASTAELVYKLIYEMRISITPEIATGIYLGISTDTGAFRYSNTSALSFGISAKMISAGANPFRIAQSEYGNYSLSRIKLKIMALKSIEISEDGEVAIMTIDSEMFEKTGASYDDMAGLTNYVINIKNVKVAALIKEYSTEDPDNKDDYNFSVSMRSEGKIDVSDIAATFGGGGHFNAAGFLIRAELSDLKQQLLTILK